MSDLRFPIGRFVPPQSSTEADYKSWIRDIAEMPAHLRNAVAGLTEEQLGTPYRPEGWTVRQLVHHIADSHMNAYMRFKLTVTEDNPTIKTYDEKVWAEQPDKEMDVDVSLGLVENLHARWTHAMRAWPAAEFHRKLQHPELGPMRLDIMLSLYAWHSRHHVAHITALRKREGW